MIIAIMIISKTIMTIIPPEAIFLRFFPVFNVVPGYEFVGIVVLSKFPLDRDQRQHHDQKMSAGAISFAGETSIDIFSVAAENNNSGVDGLVPNLSVAQS